MKKNITNLIILDASSSMSFKTNEVRSGLTELLSEIKSDMKKNKKEVNTTTIVCQFSYSRAFTVLVNTSKRKEIDLNIANQYHPNGMTALYDAIGEGFSLVPKKQDGVFVNILTDGEENASRDFTKIAIKKMLADAEEKKWGITFMGTTAEAIQNAVNLGVSSSNTFRFQDSSQGVETSNLKRSKARGTYYSSVLTSTSSDDIQTTGLI